MYIIYDNEHQKKKKNKTKKELIYLYVFQTSLYCMLLFQRYIKYVTVPPIQVGRVFALLFLWFTGSIQNALSLC